MKWKGRRLLAMALTGILLAGCGQPDRSMIMQRMREVHRRLPPKQRELKAEGFKGQDQGRGFTLIGSGRRQWIYLYT